VENNSPGWTKTIMESQQHQLFLIQGSIRLFILGKLFVLCFNYVKSTVNG